MVQFEVVDWSLRPHFFQVVTELDDDLDAWEVAVWFASKNVWLDGERPADVLDTDLASVIQAARVDRFISRG